MADALSACREIVELGGPDGTVYKTSRVDALAIERLFEIIGEALGRIRRTDPVIFDTIGNAAEIIAFRNVLSHGYDQVSPDRVVVSIAQWLRNWSRILLQSRRS